MTNQRSVFESILYISNRTHSFIYQSTRVWYTAFIRFVSNIFVYVRYHVALISPLPRGPVFIPVQFAVPVLVPVPVPVPIPILT